MTILCLDLGIKTGYTLVKETFEFTNVYLKIQEHGLIINKDKNPVKQKTMQRFYNNKIFAKFYSAIHNMCVLHDVKEIYYEAVHRHTSTCSAHMYGGWLAVLSLVTEDLNIELTPVGVSTIKKSILGRFTGNIKVDRKTSKRKIVNAVTDLGYDLTIYKGLKDNVADALALALYVIKLKNQNEQI